MLISEKDLCKRIGCPISWARQYRKDNLDEETHWVYNTESSRRVKPVMYTEKGSTVLENAFIKHIDENDINAINNFREDIGIIGTVAAKFVNPRLVKVIVGDGEPELCQVRDSRNLTIGSEIPVKKNSGTSTPWTLEISRIVDGKHRFISLEKLIRANKL